MKKVGLALSGGGPRGLIHIGVIKVLEKNNIPIDCIAGSSVGAFIGGIYAATKDVRILEQITASLKKRTIFSLFFDPVLKSGLIKGDKIINFIKKYVGDIEFSQLKIPFTAVATDFNTGEKFEINEGKLCQAIRASIAVPFFFKPVTIDDKILVDGAISSPLPVASVKKMGANLSISVNLYDKYLSQFSENQINIITVLQLTTKILLHNLAETQAKEADISISPQSTKIGWGKLLSRVGSQQGIDLGTQATEKKIKEIQNLLKAEKTGFFSCLRRFFRIR